MQDSLLLISNGPKWISSDRNSVDRNQNGVFRSASKINYCFSTLQAAPGRRTFLSFFFFVFSFELFKFPLKVRRPRSSRLIVEWFAWHKPPSTDHSESSSPKINLRFRVSCQLISSCLLAFDARCSSDEIQGWPLKIQSRRFVSNRALRTTRTMPEISLVLFGLVRSFPGFSATSAKQNARLRFSGL